MDHRLKMNILQYYEGSTCQCGAPKHIKRWTCLICREVGKTLEQDKVLNAACENHLEQALKYLDEINHRRFPEC